MSRDSSTAGCEHFVAVLDNNFLPIALCLHGSLVEQARPFNLWILCLDEELARNLRTLSLPHVTLMPLAELEDDRLLAVKATRKVNEYCWTLKPFAMQRVFELDENVQRVTYLDSDLFFFDDPRELLDEFAATGRHAMITEHAFDAAYDKSRRCGRFCAQLVTFRRTPEAERIMHWWQDRCLEWCFARVEDGKFADQKYLEQWPVLFAEDVHILRQQERTLAPWNARRFERGQNGRLAPVLYHFHGLRLIAPGKLMLYSGYDIGIGARALYQIYAERLGETISSLREAQIEIPYLPLRKDWWGRLLRLKRGLIGGNGYANLPVDRLEQS